MPELERCYLIAEIGCNHRGESNTAFEMIKIAKECGADAVKFQKRNNREVLTPEQYNMLHPVPENSYGRTYGEHREALEFTISQHAKLKQYCDNIGIAYSSSVWDLTSAKEIASLSPAFIKIPSACNNNTGILTWLCDNFDGEIHISVGMTTHAEEKEIIDLFKRKKRNNALVLYACTSGYPVPPKDACLLEIKRLKDGYGQFVKRIGFSSHCNGTTLDPVAYSLGAEVIERHFTLDRTWKGTDHAASLEPAGLITVRKKLEVVREAYTNKKCEILPIEQIQRDKLKFKRTSNVNLNERPWGNVTVLEHKSKYNVKRLFLYPQHRISYQSPQFKIKAWTVVSGTATVIIEGEIYTLGVGESINIKAGQKHQLANNSDFPLEIIETQFGDTLCESDIVLFDDDCGRGSV